MTGPRVAVAMSGGVDSSVSALLLKQAGYDVIGITMQLFGSAQDKAARQAAAVAAALGIEHHIVDLSNQFQKSVVDYFCDEYSRGRTPNPCVVCNKAIKFGALLAYADSIEAPYLATGHYAKIEKSASEYGLQKAVDLTKDQSYFLYRLTQDQLSRVLFPLGEMTKIQVRQLAQQAELPAHSSESQDICFLEGGDYRSFLEIRTELAQGDIVNEAGTIVGYHQGLWQYTVGQRQGLGIASNVPFFVIAIDGKQNRIIIGGESALFRRTVHVEDLTWISGSWPAEKTGLTARIRYRMPDAPISTLEPEGETGASITFVDPVRAITPGQSAVIYKCGEVLGGGIITG